MKSKGRQRQVRARVRKRARRRPARRPAPGAAAPPLPVRTKEEGALSKILSGEKTERIPEDAMVFSAIMSNLTPSLRDLNKKAGMHAGMHLYHVMARRRNYTWYQDAVADLIRFLENAGYPNVMYHIFPDSISIQVHDKSHEYLGMNMHSFEAGLISGFLTAARRQYTAVEEAECSNNGFGYCGFSTRTTQPYQQEQGKANAAVQLLVQHIARQTEGRERAADLRIAPEYYILSSATMLDGSYSEEMQQVARHIGRSVGERLLGSSQVPARHAKAASAKISAIIRLLNLGRPNVKSLHPVRIDVSFDRLHSTSEFVNISMAFVSGLLANHAKGALTVTKEARKGAYRVSIAEKQRKK